LAVFLNQVRPESGSGITIAVFSVLPPQIHDRATNPAVEVWTDGTIVGIDFASNLLSRLIRGGRDTLRFGVHPSYVAWRSSHLGRHDRSVHGLATGQPIDDLRREYNGHGIIFDLAPDTQTHSSTISVPRESTL
jgi:hypothetical protein